MDTRLRHRRGGPDRPAAASGACGRQPDNDNPGHAAEVADRSQAINTDRRALTAEECGRAILSGRPSLRLVGALQDVREVEVICAGTAGRLMKKGEMAGGAVYLVATSSGSG